MSQSNVTLLPSSEHTPFSAAHWREIQALLRQLDSRQSLWLSGYLAAQSTERETTPEPTAQAAVWVLYGSETGNSEAIAKDLSQQLKQHNTEHRVLSLARVKPRELKRADILLVICSTHGDGDPPEPAIGFFEALETLRENDLKGKRHAVLALGDSSYEHFCTAGQALHKSFSQLGSEPLLDCVDCDVDYQQAAQQWCEQLQQHLPVATHTATLLSVDPAAGQESAVASSISRDNPLSVEVLENIRLSADTRARPIHHLELLLEPATVNIAPGDAIGVIPNNPPALIATVLRLSGLSGDEPVAIKGRALSLVEAFRECVDLTVPSPNLLTLWASLSDAEGLKTLADADRQTQRAYLKTTSVSDLLSHPALGVEPQALIDALRPLQPRLYDVANAFNQDSDELHITVKDYRYQLGEQQHTGIASDYLLNLELGELVRAYVHQNKRFRLPDDTSAAIILIAQGTGIAPYRAFIQTLSELASAPPVWLFLQEHSREEDFLYQADWQQAQADGVLSNIHTLFTADTPNTTLADVFASCCDELASWLQEGAHLYICGEKTALSGAEQSLQTVCDNSGDDNLWQDLKAQKRLHKNLY